MQILTAKTDDLDASSYERKLFLAQKSAEQKALEHGIEEFYICSFSNQTIVYKGMLNSPQMRPYFKDLKNDKYDTAFAIFHQRYSTNTFPFWHLAQPFRMMAHNGEINTMSCKQICLAPVFFVQITGPQHVEPSTIKDP